ncbi:hypothetical protein F5141DRAFT_1190943 [Pisolithus sp. B1]|nr:hypothetical protein F5141DRAFT_1190943 [Pisolithus sp. B1]
MRDEKRACPTLTVNASPSSLNEHPTVFDQPPVVFKQGEAGDMDDETKDNPFHEEHGWKLSLVSFCLPKEKECFISEDAIPIITIDGIYHQDLTDMTVAAFKDPEFSRSLHMTPYTQHWKTADHHTHIVASLMVWLDSTHLASFGNASMWPFYLFFANQSKYTQCKPSAQACHHITYIPMLPADFQETYASQFDEPATSEMYMHCKHELYQGVWHLLLDKKFMHAYQYGIAVPCTDGIAHYSADYPKKVLIARIKFLGTCPCPRCLTKKTNLHKMGMVHDMRCRIKKIQVNDCDRCHHIVAACWLIFEKVISALLNEFLYVPTYNAFSDHLFQFGFNYFKLLLIDLLHKFKLGVWKAIFTHLIHILYAASGQGIQELNKSPHRVIMLFPLLGEAPSANLTGMCQQ